MKYYCENCGTEYSVTSETDAALESYRKDFAGIIGGSEIKCGICPYIPNSLPSELKPLPVYETVAQWEKRKGRKYPANGAVFWKYKPIMNSGVAMIVWMVSVYANVPVNETTGIVIVATEAGAPPDDWWPE